MTTWEGPTGYVSNVVFDVILARRSSGPAELRIREVGNDVTQGGNIFFDVGGQGIIDHVSTGLNLNNSDTGFATFSTSGLTYKPDAPHVSLYAEGWDGSNIVAGLISTAARFRDLSFDAGISINSFSFGGATVDGGNPPAGWFERYPNAGPWLKYVGPWSLVLSGFGANHFGGQTPEQFKASMLNFIDTIRSSSWLGSPNQFIALVSEFPIQLTGDNLSNFNKMAAVQAEVATERPNVVAINYTRWLNDQVADPLALLADSAHYGEASQKQQAQLFWEMLDTLTTP